MSDLTPPSFNVANHPGVPDPPTPAVGPSIPPSDGGAAGEETAAAGIVATIGPVIQQQIEQATERLRNELQQALDGFAYNIEQRLEAERQGFAGTITQLGQNDENLLNHFRTLEGIVREQRGPEVTKEGLEGLVATALRDFLMEGIEAWARRVGEEMVNQATDKAAQMAAPEAAPEKGIVQ